MKLLLSFILLIPLMSFSQIGKTKWDYPVKPGSPEWRNLKNNVEKVHSCQLPDDLLTQLKTSDLLDICLDYPLLPDIFAFNNINDGFEKFESDFNGFRELIKRPDCAKEMILMYKSMHPENIKSKITNVQKGAFIVHFSLFELMLSHNKVIEQMTLDEKRTLLTDMEINRREKMIHSFGNGKIGIQSGALAAINIIRSDVNYQLTINSKIQNFICNGIMENPEISDEIEDIVNHYLNAKE